VYKIKMNLPYEAFSKSFVGLFEVSKAISESEKAVVKKFV
jgi:hypothetical protein